MRIVSLVIACLAIQCHTLKTLTLCTNVGTMIRGGEMAGCQWLIQHRDGRTFLPENGDEFEWVDRQAVMFSYQSFDGMSICMMEDEIITLTCLQRIGEMVCEPSLEIADIGWLDQLIEARRPVSVSRYTVDKTLYYEISFSDGKTTWHDCEGTLMCLEASGCDFSEKDLGEPTIVYVAHR